MDIEKIKQEILDWGKLAGETKDNYMNDRFLKKLEDSLETVEEIRQLTVELSDKVSEGNVVLQGTMALVSKENAGEYKHISETSIEGLKKLYDGKRNGGLVKKILMAPIDLVTGNRDVTLKNALNLIENISQEIPPYVQRLSEELKRKRKDLCELRQDIRGNIEKLISSRLPIENARDESEKVIRELETEYHSLEKEREELTSEGKPANELLNRLHSLEIPIEQAKESYGELKIRVDSLQGNINLYNDQIGKIGQLIDLLDETRNPVNLAREFVNVHVPYIIGEVRTQKSQVHSLTGVNRVMNFLQREAEFSGILNDRIKLGSDYLNVKVKEIRDNLPKTIYHLEPGKQVEAQYSVEE
ncbi:MAG: hypothetical protein Q8P15_00840 [Nanoarchaeota archaeon]|nr:hypothetical protein [Nanoarchaeota archaeon]